MTHAERIRRLEVSRAINHRLVIRDVLALVAVLWCWLGLRPWAYRWRERALTVAALTWLAVCIAAGWTCIVGQDVAATLHLRRRDPWQQ